MTIFLLQSFSKNSALIDGDNQRILSYTEVDILSKQIGSLFPKEKSLIFIFNQNLIEDVIAYIGLMNTEHTICLLDAQMNESFRNELIEIYTPDYIIESTSNKKYFEKGYQCISSDYGVTIEKIANEDNSFFLNPRLKLLLTTSGTTGNPKLIRLSKENLMSNATSIIEYLKINSNEKPIASLPFHYSYGLSVLHSHLLVGASIVLTQSSVVQEKFWDILRTQKCTSLAGVPYTYKIMDRIGFDQLNLPSLQTLTQAGGALETQLVLKYNDIMRVRGGSFVVMYGQTEATARIAYLPNSYLPAKAGAIGIAIPKGTLKIYHEDQQIKEPKQVGELVYEGPNVMLGYASEKKDLAKDDDMHGKLHTGDLGYFDEEGIFYVTGRLKRISKIYGLRINLDDIEKALNGYGIVAVTSTDHQIDLFIENGSSEDCQKCIQHLVDLYKLHPTTFRCHVVTQLPRTSSGKVDYQQLRAL